MSVQTFRQDPALHFLRVHPEEELLDHLVILIFKFLKSFHIVFYSCCTSLDFH